MYSMMIQEMEIQSIESQLDVIFSICEYYQKENQMICYMEDVEPVAKGSDDGTVPGLRRGKNHPQNQSDQKSGPDMDMSHIPIPKLDEPPTFSPGTNHPQNQLVSDLRPGPNHPQNQSIPYNEMPAEKGDVKKINNNITFRTNAIMDMLQKIFDLLQQLVAKTVDQQAMQSNAKNEEMLQQSLQQNPPASPEQTAQEVTQEIQQENPNQPVPQEVSTYALAALTGNFKDVTILSQDTVNMITQCKTTLDQIVLIDRKSQTPQQFEQSVLKELRNADARLQKVIANHNNAKNQQNQQNQTQNTTVMNWEQFSTLENQINGILAQSQKSLKQVDQSFKAGGIGNFFKWATQGNINATNISQQAMTEFQTCVKNIRTSISNVAQIMKMIRKVNASLCRKMGGLDRQMVRAQTQEEKAQQRMDGTNAGTNANNRAAAQLNRAQNAQQRVINKAQQVGGNGFFNRNNGINYNQTS
jgi:hypothetical protein